MAETRFGGDLVVGALAELGIEYAAINPGASFRGIHESLVALGKPELILALHENVAVAAADGYARSAQRPMAVVLHNLVGLQSGAMGIFNAWANQSPMVVIGGSGPADAATRRPWIDWVHSARQQVLVARDHLKWDDQPASLAALPDSIFRAHRIATTVPYGPTYVSVDIALQEAELAPEQVALLKAPAGQARGNALTAPPTELEDIADRLVRADNPVLVADNTGKDKRAYDALVRLAELLAAPVVDLQARHNFPTGHWADCTPARSEVLADADVVLVLDPRDLMHAIGAVDHIAHGYRPLVRPEADVICISTNQLMLRGFLDYCGPTGDAFDVLADTTECLPVLADLVSEGAGDRQDRRKKLAAYTRTLHPAPAATVGESGEFSQPSVSRSVFEAVRHGPWELANGHMRGAVRSTWELTRFNSHLGRNVGAGLGYGIGVSIGAALAHRGDDTVIVNLQNDGDLLYTPSGLWTAAKYDLPILTVVINNRTYAQDRMHQTVTAKKRSRPLDHASVGIDIDEPAVDFAALGRSQGVESWSPTEPDEFEKALTTAVAACRDERRPTLVEVVVPKGVQT
ncbi:MAG: thiamine pyrophosphate-binding protein [Thermocrispum agreste]|uniref:Thiamine pyrophosphate-binding protein n=1 Tax=Thermocrispum agreste TaxID=37925 RepID=A0ABD6FCL4_9PSEU